MDFNKKPPALLYLDKNGFYFFEEGLPNVVSAAFTEDAVRVMDVINSAILLTQIKTFTEQYKLIPAAITIVLSPNVVFEKDIVGLSYDEQENTVKAFVDTVPFESVLYRSYPIEKGVKVICCNEDLFQELKNAFEKASFNIESVVPYQLLGVDQTLIKNLTADTASQFLKRADHLKQFTILTTEKEKQQTQTTPASSTPAAATAPVKKVNVRLYGMIGIFAVLFIILGYMLMNMNKF